MPRDPLMKVCPNPTCLHEQRPQPIENFHFNKSAPDGRQGYCKECMRAWRRASYDPDKERRANQRHWKRRQAYQRTYMKEYRQGKRRRQP